MMYLYRYRSEASRRWFLKKKKIQFSHLPGQKKKPFGGRLEDRILGTTKILPYNLRQLSRVIIGKLK